MAAMKDSNHLKVVMEKGKAAFGCWQMAPGSNVSRTLARTGVDFVVVDCERRYILTLFQGSITIHGSTASDNLLLKTRLNRKIQALLMMN